MTSWGNKKEKIMTRLFDEHVIRQVKDLNGVWTFKKDEKDIGESAEWQNGFSDGQKVSVPGMWNNEFGLLEYEGAGWYCKRFYTRGGTLEFSFGGVMTKADVWLDGEKLGEHYGGFNEFSFIKREVEEGWRVLVVRADNRFDEAAIPQPRVDWYHYGGITREVSVATLKGICALYGKTDYTILKDGGAEIFQTVELYNAENERVCDLLRVSVGGKETVKEISLNAGEKRTEVVKLRLEKVQLWGLESPTLYEVEIKTSTDDYRSRIGFRTVEVKPDGVYLNGRFVEICGVNRHEEHPEWGFAMPLKLSKADLDIAIEMGCNSIRGSHYPQSRGFLDYCDEKGILFWSEIPIWGGGFTTQALGNEKILARGLKMHEEMVRAYYDHPSIIIWGMHNEINSFAPEAYEMTKRYYAYLKENGGNRIVTYATDKPFEDICLELCDIICINMYKGWYGGEISSWDGALEEFRARRKSLGLEHKPVIFSEFGAAAIFGHKSFDDVRWTEEYQAKLLAYCLNLFHSDPMVCGAYIWQFTDIRSTMEINRARGFNNKGVLNEFRKPKLAYFAVRDLYKKFQKEEKRCENVRK